MVSRKKLKGKARKAAKAEAAKGPLFPLLHQLRLRKTNNNVGCTHGWDDPSEYPPDHDCNKMLEAVLDIITKATVAGAACSDAIDVMDVR